MNKEFKETLENQVEKLEDISQVKKNKAKLIFENLGKLSEDQIKKIVLRSSEKLPEKVLVTKSEGRENKEELELV